MQNKSTEELISILNEVCAELQSRTKGLADIGGSVEPIVSITGNTFMTVHVGSTLGVKAFSGSLGQFRTNLFDKGVTLTDKLETMEGQKTLLDKVKQLLNDGKERKEGETLQRVGDVSNP